MTSLRDLERKATLDALSSMGFISPAEVEAVRRLAADPGLRSCLACAETIHLHVKVEDTGRVTSGALAAVGAVLDHGREGFVKFRLPGALNAIFSHIAVSADDLREGEAGARPRPFRDHIGVDLRRETDESRALFDAIPRIAGERAWAHVPQGGKGRPVRCCHAEVAEKHWVFPATPGGVRCIPIEFAYGALRHGHGASGCDLRPSHPEAARAAPQRCCGG